MTTPTYNRHELDLMVGIVRRAEELCPVGEWLIRDNILGEDLASHVGMDDGYTLQLCLSGGWRVCEVDVGLNDTGDLFATIAGWHWSSFKLEQFNKIEPLDDILRQVALFLRRSAEKLLARFINPGKPE